MKAFLILLVSTMFLILALMSISTYKFLIEAIGRFPTWIIILSIVYAYGRIIYKIDNSKKLL